MTIVRRATLYYTSGTSDKEYQIYLEEVSGGFLVYGKNGRRGAATARQNKTKSGPVSLGEANRIFEEVFEEKSGTGGYTTDPSGTPHGPATLPPRAAASSGASSLPVQFDWAPNGATGELEDLLLDDTQVAQWVPSNSPAARCRAHVNSSGVVRFEAIGTARPFVLAPSSALTEELGELFPDMCLDGYLLDKETLHIVDGFGLSDAAPGARASLSTRLAWITAALATAEATQLRICPWAAGGEDKAQLHWAMTETGAEGLWLMRQDAGYTDSRPKALKA